MSLQRNEPAAADEGSRLARPVRGLRLTRGAGRTSCAAVALIALIALIAIGALDVALARADSASAALPTLPSCPPSLYDPSELREALAIELAQRHLDPTTLSRIELAGCSDVAVDGEARAPLDLRVFDANAAPILGRAIRLDDTPFEARARLLALWIAESLAARGDRSASADPASRAREDATATEDGDRRDGLEDAVDPLTDDAVPDASAVVESGPSIDLGAALLVRSPLSELASFWGAEASLSGPVASYLRWAIEGGLAVHTSSTPLGELHVTWMSAAAGFDLADGGSPLLSLGPRLSLSHVSAIGENSLGITSIEQSANIVSLGARASVGTAIGRGWQLTAHVVAERALRGVVFTAGRQRALSLDGWSAATGVGLHYAF